MINRLLNHIHRFLAQDLSEFKADISNLFVRAINSIKSLPVLMEDKRLNINQPLLSVRRLSPKASQQNESRKFGSYLPTMSPTEPCKTEFKLDPLKNTGSIPFVWEHSPGRPKDETPKQIQTQEYPLGLPKLPPGRISKPRKKDPDNTTEDHVHIHNHNHTNVPKNHSNLQTVSQTEEKTSRFDRSKSIKQEKSESSDDNNETFMDALDTLSRGDQSTFYNCSASGVNLTHDHQSDVNPSGIHKSDPKLRDFMMGRFIPAAKAMASETPQHSSRKQIFKDNTREVKKLANMENKKLQLRYGPTFLQDCKEEEEDSDHEYYHDEHENTSFKFCGLIPRFCSKGTLNLVGPVPGMSMRTRTHFSSNSLGSFIEIENRSFARSHLAKHHDSILTSSSSSSSNQRNCNHPKLEGSKLYNRLQGRGNSAGFKESFQSSGSGNKSTSQRKRLSFKDLLNDKHKNGKENQDSIVEKTLYVDTENSIPSNFKQENSQGTDNNNTQGMETEVVDQDSKDSDEDSAYDLPAPPPLPKSPSDSWLGRALPSVSAAKQTSIRWNPRFRSSDMLTTETESDKNTTLRLPKGPLLPIPES